MPVPTPQDLDSLRWEKSPHAQDRPSLYLFHAQKERGWFSFLQYHPRVACPISPLISIVLTFQALLYYVLRRFVGTRGGAVWGWGLVTNPGEVRHNKNIYHQ